MAVTSGLPVGARLRPLRVEAVGDDFAQVSGVWLTGERVARYVRGASRVWAFSAMDTVDVPQVIEAVAGGTGLYVVGIEPGARPGWGRAGRRALSRLLDGLEAEAAVGLLMAVPPPACADGGKCTGRGDCGGCRT